MKHIKKRILFLLRLSIYSGGIFVVLLVTYLNAYKSKYVEYSFNENENNMPEYFTISSFENFEYAQTTLEVKDDWNVSKIELKASKIISPLIKKQKETITTTEEMRDILFDNNQSSHPNGSLLSYKKDLFLVSKGKLHKFSSKKIFSKLGFNSKKIKQISRSEYVQFDFGSAIDEKFLIKNNFPRDVIVKSENIFFITGANSVRAIFSEEIIQNVWSDFDFVETNSIVPHKMANSKCFAESNKQAYCETDLQFLNSKIGNTYYFTVQGVSKEAIKELKIKIRKKITLKNLWQSFW